LSKFGVNSNKNEEFNEKPIKWTGLGKEFYENLRKNKEVNIVKITNDNFCGFKFPQITTFLAKIILVVNMLLPGIGTIAVSFYNKSKTSNKAAFMSHGVIQLLTSLCLVGWIIAFAFSLQLIVFANELETKNIKDYDETKDENKPRMFR